jgi:hypothetical protein
LERKNTSHNAATLHGTFVSEALSKQPKHAGAMHAYAFVWLALITSRSLVYYQ